MAFRDFLEGETSGKIKITTNISGAEAIPVAYFFRSYDAMPPWEKQVINKCTGRILDVGAGAGCHALELQRRGMDVTAMDISGGAAETLRRRGVRKVVHGSLFDFGNGDTPFDTILFLMNGAGMAGSLDRLRPLFAKASSLLLPGGTIYLESTDLMYMYEEEDGSVVIPLGERYYGEIEYLLSYKGHSSAPFYWLFVDPDNLAEIASRSGLTTEIIYRGESHNYVAALRHTL